jgi:hypothetical protein
MLPIRPGFGPMPSPSRCWAIMVRSIPFRQPHWTRARLAGLRGRRSRIFADLLTNGSDSYQLNNAGGGDPPGSIPSQRSSPSPEAWKLTRHGRRSARLVRLQHAMREPWDGPAGLIYLDGRYAIAHEDRNGYRPLRYVETKDGLFHLPPRSARWRSRPPRSPIRFSWGQGRSSRSTWMKGASTPTMS